MISRAMTVIFIILVYHLGGFFPLAAAQPSLPVFDRSEVDWNRLTLKSNNFLGKVKTQIVLEELPVDEVKASLVASHRGDMLSPSGDGVVHLTINSEVDPLFGSDELLVTRVWFSPQTSTALQRIRLRQGKEKWEKTYRWTANGVYRLRIRPKDADEENLPVKDWTDKQNSFYPYDVEQSKCASVSESSVLLFVASAAGLAVGDQPRHLCVFNKKQLHLVQFQAEKSQPLQVNYRVKSPNEESRREGEVEVLKIAFTTRSLHADQARAEPFSFLGLKGDFDIFIDRVSRIPVQISGKIPGVGTVAIRLQEVVIGP